MTPNEAPDAKKRSFFPPTFYPTFDLPDRLRWQTTNRGPHAAYTAEILETEKGRQLIRRPWEGEVSVFFFFWGGGLNHDVAKTHVLNVLCDFTSSNGPAFYQCFALGTRVEVHSNLRETHISRCPCLKETKTLENLSTSTSF